MPANKKTLTLEFVFTGDLDDSILENIQNLLAKSNEDIKLINHNNLLEKMRNEINSFDDGTSLVDLACVLMNDLDAYPNKNDEIANNLLEYLNDPNE